MLSACCCWLSAFCIPCNVAAEVAFVALGVVFGAEAFGVEPALLEAPDEVLAMLPDPAELVPFEPKLAELLLFPPPPPELCRLEVPAIDWPATSRSIMAIEVPHEFRVIRA